MTDIEKKALALLNKVSREMGLGTVRKLEMDMTGERALLRAIERHEAFRQEVSDAVEAAINDPDIAPLRALQRFIIAKPDPLIEAVGEAMEAHEVYSKFELTDSLREALAKRGMKIAMEND